MNDLGALCIAFAVALLWLRLCDALAAQGVLEVKLSRKIIHIGTGPLFIATWPLFSEASSARYMAALVPLSICLQFAAVGLGFLKDPEAVAAMTRTGNPREILGGPLLYGLVHTAITASFWRESVAGVVALMLLCGGDGFADIFGRRYGKARLPWNRNKSLAGSAAMFVFGYLFSQRGCGDDDVLQHVDTFGHATHLCFDQAVCGFHSGHTGGVAAVLRHRQRHCACGRPAVVSGNVLISCIW
eukprot:CAMPEP_0114318674 /NCGR_PEP_ID=MMETSP0059-20121206/24785_1 /TAXON_ID=36894 /ORGANISM="Pyramimonas parkeae, Strain CCMP726" /LENGTH=242 /DNA_ID=CAMNT_0001445533 /DNA_START=490 /DNA_END=1215 /DNA_ORIENTATION=-